MTLQNFAIEKLLLLETEVYVIKPIFQVSARLDSIFQILCHSSEELNWIRQVSKEAKCKINICSLKLWRQTLAPSSTFEED